MKWSKNAKIVGGITAGTAVLGTGAYLAKKHYDKKKFVWEKWMNYLKIYSKTFIK